MANKVTSSESNGEIPLNAVRKGSLFTFRGDATKIYMMVAPTSIAALRFVSLANGDAHDYSRSSEAEVTVLPSGTKVTLTVE